MVLSILSLTFKLAIVDTYFKDEIKNARVCSMFISDYMPQFFIALSSVLVSAKAILLVFLSKDTLTSYRTSHTKRQRIANYIISPIYLMLFVLMNFRFTRTCYRTIDIVLKDEIDVRTHNHFSILYAIKLVCIIAIVACFFQMKGN